MYYLPKCTFYGTCTAKGAWMSDQPDKAQKTSLVFYATSGGT